VTRILLTGASGFIGRHLQSRLNHDGHQVITTGDARDIWTNQFWRDLPATDQVIHLAAKSFVPDSWVEPESFFRVNLLGTINALNYCRKHGAKLFLLSSFLYENKASHPLSESEPVMASNPYALTKLMSEQAGSFFSEFYDVPVICLRLFNVYGPGQSERFLIPKICRQVLNSDEIHVETITPRRDFIYIDDVLDVFLDCLAASELTGTFNVGTGISYSVKNIIDEIQDIAGTDLPVKSAEHTRISEIDDACADTKKISKALGWQPKWPLRQGLHETINSFSQQ
jgi:GDP-4-dehydro-6-deoxy-D-mannose reductase